MRQLADFRQRSPDQISEDELWKFFLHLKNDKEFAVLREMIAIKLGAGFAHNPI